MRSSYWSSDVCSSELPFERIDIGIYPAWAARTLQLQLFQRTRKRARRRQCIGTGQHVCKNRTAASRMITIIINDRGVLQAFKWFKQQRHTECARIEIVGVVANPDVPRPAVTLLILASNAQRRLAIDNRQGQCALDRKSSVEGKSGRVRVGLGGGRLI